MEAFNRYKDLKNKVEFVYRGVNISHVAAAYIWEVANNPNEKRFGLKSIVGIFAANTPNFREMPAGKIIFSTFGVYRRRDHKELNNSVIRKLDTNLVYTNDIFDWRYKIAFHPFVIIKVFSFLFKANLEGVKLSDRIAIASKYVQYINSLLNLEKIDFTGVEKYLSQSSVSNFENLLTQFFKTKGVETLSLTEGIYMVTHFNIPIDCIQFENFDADKYLMWGQSSVDSFAEYGISKSRLLVAGYPKDNEQLPMKENNAFKECMVLLSREIFRDSNKRLLEILTKDSDKIHYHLKLHPGDSPSFYEKYVNQHNMTIIPTQKTINEALNKDEFDFAIAVNTNTYYESLMRGVPCLRFCDGTFELPSGYDDIFQTAEEYDEKLSNIKDLSQTDGYQKEIDEILKYCIGIGIDNYKKIICG